RFYFFQAEDGIRGRNVTGVQTCALPIFGDHQKLPNAHQQHGKRSHTLCPSSQPKSPATRFVFGLVHVAIVADAKRGPTAVKSSRSEEHTSELQSRFDLVCRLLLEKKNIS